jgi:ubiquinone/menaquinone biosynthesis C-methylase UbiE
MAYSFVQADDKSVIGLYGERTVLTSCVYLRPYVKATSNILDVGCGPGVITSDLAKIAYGGKTIGIDISPGIIAEAQAAFPASEVHNLYFAVGDAIKLAEYADNSFDIVHAHALLVHVPDPVAALKEFYRILKPGGIAACRDASSSIVLSLEPDLPAIRAHWDRVLASTTQMGGHTDAGIKLEMWAKEAGFGTDGGKIITSKSQQWSPSHLGITRGKVGEKAVKYGMATMQELETWSKGWEEWEATDGHEFVFEAGEILCWKGT